LRGWIKKAGPQIVMIVMIIKIITICGLLLPAKTLTSNFQRTPNFQQFKCGLHG
jgi:hypothetical protein